MTGSTPSTGSRQSQAGPEPADAVQRVDRYELVRQLGEGGCGVVYLAQQTEPIRREVALKMIKLGMDTKQVIARFEAERQALALMEHPNIAKVLDAGTTENGRPYFVLELVDGLKITDYCDQHSLPLAGRLRLFLPVCQALDHAHRKGIIHRDIKPSNILVGISDDAPVPKVIDFGIAKATSEQQLTDKTIFTALDQFLGTPAYMSPEQAGPTGSAVDARSDIYSLGVLFYELVTGKTPFDTGALMTSGLASLRQAIRNEEPVRPSVRLRQLPTEELGAAARLRQSEPPQLIRLVSGDLDWIAMKALDKDPERRYPSAGDLARDVQRYLAQEPVLAGPPSTLYRLTKRIRKNRRPLTFAAVAGTLAAIGGLVFFLVGGEARLRDLGGKRPNARLQLQAKLHQLSMLAENLRKEGHHADAEVSLRDALAIQKKLVSGDHSELAATLDSLGQVLQAEGKLAEAEVMFRRAWSIRSRALGKDHPDAVASGKRLAEVLRAQGKSADAETLLQRN